MTVSPTLPSSVTIGLPLKAMRAFVVVAETRSISKAARRLGVSASAISHQMTILEAFIAKRVVASSRSRVLLTSDGEAFAEALSPAFAQIEDAVRRAMVHEPFVLECHPLFLLGCDPPNPIQSLTNVELRIASRSSSDALGAATAALRFGDHTAEGLSYRQVGELPLVLLAPGADAHPQRLTEDLPLLVSDDWPDALSLWRRAQPDFQPAKTHALDSISSALLACEQGLGQLIAPHRLVATIRGGSRLRQAVPVGGGEPSPAVPIGIVSRPGANTRTLLEVERAAKALLASL